MKHETLFNEYQRELEWIKRRMDPKTMEFHNEKPEDWRHAKEVAFNLYESLRQFCEDGCPRNHEAITIDGIDKYPPFDAGDGYVCAVVGVLRYRGLELPVYCDDYGMSDFVVYGDEHIPVDSFAGSTDWYYELDKKIDHIYD